MLWAKTKDYVGKVLFINAGESLSLQYHKEKEETLFLQSGQCLLDTGPDENHLQEIIMNPGDVFHVTPGTLHRLKAKTDCHFFEVSTPQLDDVVRLKDRYGRN